MSETQRKEIYDIQKKYTENIHALQTQIMELVKQRDSEVEAVLTAEQLQRVAALVTEARARRAKSQPATPAVPDATPAPDNAGGDDSTQ